MVSPATEESMKELIRVFDDVVPETLSSMTLDAFSNEFFPWYWQDATVGAPIDIPQFVHPFRLESLQEFNHLDMFDKHRQMAYNCAKGIFERGIGAMPEDAGTVHRIKANLTQPNIVKHSAAHVDMKPDYYYSMLYYINDADGDTVFFSEGDKPENEIARVSPKKGRIAIFPSNISHCGSSPIHTKRRMVINYIFTVLR
jgi:hypothetical protein